MMDAARSKSPRRRTISLNMLSLILVLSFVVFLTQNSSAASSISGYKWIDANFDRIKNDPAKSRRCCWLDD